MSEGLKNNLTSQTPANDGVFANEVGKTSKAVNDALDNPAKILEKFYNSITLKLLFGGELNPGEMVDGIGDLRHKQAANDEAFSQEHKKAAYK